MSNRVGLVTTLHDPAGKIGAFLPEHLPRLIRLYDFFAVVATPESSAETLNLLKKEGAIVLDTATRDVGESRRRALTAGIDARADIHYHYCDLDRLIHWHIHYPAELRIVINAIAAQAGFIAIGRTERALKTHPIVQIEAEELTNRGFTFAFDADSAATTTHDVVAGSCGMSYQAATAILQHSTEPSNATDCEWPMIINCLTKLPVTFYETEGLEFETATFWGDGVFEQSKTHENWWARVKLARASIEAAMRIGRMPKNKPPTAY